MTSLPKANLSDLWSRIFSGWMPFTLSNQHCCRIFMDLKFLQKIQQFKKKQYVDFYTRSKPIVTKLYIVTLYQKLVVPSAPQSAAWYKLGNSPPAGRNHNHLYTLYIYSTLCTAIKEYNITLLMNCCVKRCQELVDQPSWEQSRESQAMNPCQHQMSTISNQSAVLAVPTSHAHIQQAILKTSNS